MASNATVLELAVFGMTCGSCVRHVSEALETLDGVEDAEVSLSRGIARIAYDAESATVEQMIGSIREAGYEARVAEEKAATGLPVRSGCGSSCCA